MSQSKIDHRSLRNTWDQTWSRVTQEHSGSALWDVEHGLSAEFDWSVFKSAFSASLPLLDVGCGSGHQTQFLATKYERVVGLDISPLAIGLAKERHPNLTFLQTNLFDESQVHELFERFGPVNLYLRGVLHQTPSPMRKSLLDSLIFMSGGVGSIFFHDTMIDPQTKFSSFPKALRKILLSQYAPTPFELEELQDRFPKSSFTLYTGEHSMPIFRNDEEGGLFKIPSRYFLLSPTRIPRQ